MLVSSFKESLAQALGDVDMIYWTSSELDLVIKEALLTFGAISGYWKTNILIESIAGRQVYDISKLADIKTGTGLVSTLTYQTILDWIDKDLLDYLQVVETGELIGLIDNAINTFQTETKLVLAKEQYAVAANEPVPIGEDVLDILAAYYIDSSGSYYALQRADEYSIALINNDYTLTPARPKFYSINNLSMHSIDLFPRPAENGSLELIYVVGVTSNQGKYSSCLIPDNLVPYIKYKVLADVFGSDEVDDQSRAAYANQRWQEGLIIGRNYTSIVNTKLNGVNKALSSILDFDKFRYGWRNDVVTATKNINAITTAGYNIIAFNRIPIENNYAALFECISNAPIEDADISLRVDFIPVLLDYCIHIALLKDGIAALQKTQSHLEKFLKATTAHNDYLQTRKISYLDLLRRVRYPEKQANLLVEDAA